MKKILATLALVLVATSWANAQAVDDTNVVTKFCYNGTCYQFPTVLTSATLANDRYISNVQLASNQINFTGENGAANGSIDLSSVLFATSNQSIGNNARVIDMGITGSLAITQGATTYLQLYGNGTPPNFSISPTVGDVAYGVGWDGDLSVPTKNAVYDKIETLGGGGSGDFLADGTVPMTGKLDINTVAGVGISVQGSAGGTISGFAEYGFDDLDANGEGGKLTFGDDFNSIVNANGDGVGYRSYWTAWFEGGHEGTQETDSDNYFNISGVSYNFLNANDKAFRISEANASSTADYLQFYNQEGTEVASIDVNGELSYDNTTSGLTATTTKAAIDEVEGRVDAIESGGSGISSDVTGFTNASTVDNIIRGNKTDIDGWTIPAGTVAICDDCIDYDYIQIAASDLTTDITTGTAKAYFRMPYAATLSEVRVSLLAAGTATGITVDINENGTTVLSTKLTTDATEKTSTTATTAAVISDNALADDAEITIDFDAVPTNGQGVIVTLKLIKQ